MTDKSNNIQKRYYPQNTRIFLDRESTNSRIYGMKRNKDEYNLVFKFGFFTVSSYFVGNIGTFIPFAICNVS